MFCGTRSGSAESKEGQIVLWFWTQINNNPFECKFCHTIGSKGAKPKSIAKLCSGLGQELQSPISLQVLPKSKSAKPVSRLFKK
jgi:hypothetical protein